MAKLIPLTRGQFAIVDDEDYEQLSQYNWFAQTGYSTMYAARKKWINGKKHIIWMHRVIMNTPEGMDTDHINHNGLDNRKCNLRIATKAQNRQYRRANSNSQYSRYKGVSWDKTHQRWIVQLGKDGKKFQLGYFKSEIEAAKHYNAVIPKYHGEYAYLNQIEGGE